MQVCRIQVDLEKSQLLSISDPDLWMSTVSGKFDGRPLGSIWPRIECCLEDSSRPILDFFELAPSTIGVTDRALEVLEDLLIPNGELLPIYLEGQKLHVFNPTKFVDDCVDRVASRYHYLASCKAGIEVWSFIPGRVQSESIFRVQDELTTILTVSGQPDRRLDLRERVLSNNLKGLTFEVLWEENAPLREAGMWKTKKLRRG